MEYCAAISYVEIINNLCFADLSQVVTFISGREWLLKTGAPVADIVLMAVSGTNCLLPLHCSRQLECTCETLTNWNNV